MSHSFLPRLGAALGLTALTLSGCSAIPADAEGTLDRARNGSLVVGVSEHKPGPTSTTRPEKSPARRPT